MRVFWQKGFDGASVDDLTEAMRIGRPSMYAAFGTKEQLFDRAVELYVGPDDGSLSAVLAASPCRAAILRMLTSNIQRFADPRTPPGCLLVQGALATGPSSDHARENLSQRRKQAETEVRERLERAVADGELPKDTQPDVLTRWVMVVNNGLAVQAAGGATEGQLFDTLELAMSSWPEHSWQPVRS